MYILQIENLYKKYDKNFYNSDKYYKRVEDLLKEKGRSIGKIQLRYFADKVQNNFDIIIKLPNLGCRLDSIYPRH